MVVASMDRDLSGTSKDDAISTQTPSVGDSLVRDSPDYIPPSSQDFVFTDVTHDILRHTIAPELGVGYLSPSDEVYAIFPVQGMVHGLNRRLMVNLLVWRNETQKFTNVLFLVNTGSPVSYLSGEAMSTLIGADDALPTGIRAFVHGDRVLECHLSPKDGHFRDVNVLGMDFLSMHNLSIKVCNKNKTFELVVLDE